MTQHVLDCAVSRATGESLSTIRRLGFLLAETDLPGDGDEIDAQVIDWDSLALQRSVAPLPTPRLSPASC